MNEQLQYALAGLRAILAGHAEGARVVVFHTARLRQTTMFEIPPTRFVKFNGAQVDLARDALGMLDKLENAISEGDAFGVNLMVNGLCGMLDKSPVLETAAQSIRAAL